ncbi:WG repeat-containing protein [Flavobacterium sp. RHBU_24]|uniref:WG repeat-containing protein n=1 Tax=Flavobacterium sp. RHBU_24 TaxID=3391185 RepID=UPI00398514E6
MKLICIVLLLIPALVAGQDFEKIRDSLKSEYEYIGRLINGVAEARSKKSQYTLLDKAGRQLFTPKYDYINITAYGWLEAGLRHGKSMKRGYINKDGSVRIPLSYDFVFMPSAAEIFAALKGNKGVLDTLGNIVVPLEYNNVLDAAKGYYFAEKSDLSALFHKSEKLSDFIFTDAKRFENGLSAVQLQDGRTTIIDTTGSRLFPPIKAHEIISVEKEYAIIINNKRLYGTIGLDGTTKIACKYQYIEPMGTDLIITSGGLKGLVTNDGQELIPSRFSMIASAGNNFIVHDSQGESLVSRSNVSVIPGRYDNLFWYRNRFVIAELSEKNAVYDETGKLLLPFEYSFCELWLDVAFCNKGNNCYFLKLNNPKRPLEIENAENFKPSRNYLYRQNNTAIFSNKGSYGILSVNAEVLVAPVYEDLEYIDGSDEYIAKQNGKYGIINTRGEVKQPLIYDSAHWVKEVIVLRKGNKSIRYSYHVNASTADFRTP